MARGFESKSVDEQQAEARREPAQNQTLSPQEMEGRRKRDGLLLSRKNIQSQLSSVTNPTHRQMLEAALAELDRQLAELGP